MTTTYNSIFPSKDDKEADLIVEGIENCVTKNLYSELFADGVGGGNAAE